MGQPALATATPGFSLLSLEGGCSNGIHVMSPSPAQQSRRRLPLEMKKGEERRCGSSLVSAFWTLGPG